MSCGLRDVLSFEGLERPAVLVASAAFADAAVHQSAALGQPDLRHVLVSHPIQDRSDHELRELAQGCVEEVLGAISGPGTRGAANGSHGPGS